MKFKVFFTVIFFFCAFNLVAQEKKNTIDFHEIIREKSPNYFDLQKKLRKLPFEKLQDFYTLCVDENYIIGQIYALNNLGIYYRQKSKFNEALVEHNKALALCKENSLVSLQLASLNLIGVCYRRKDDIRNALDFHQNVISLANKIKDTAIHKRISVAVAQNSLGNIYASLKQYELAIEQFKKALKTQQKNNLRGLAINHQNIGECYEHLNMFDKAVENYNKSLKYNIEINSTLGKVICSNSLSSILIKEGEYEKALKKLESIAPFSKEIRNKYYASETLGNLGWVQLKLKNYDSALKNLNEALEINERLNIKKKLRIDILHHLSDLFKEKNDIKKSFFYYRKAVDLEKNTIGQRNNIYVSNLISKQDLQSQANALNDLEKETKIQALRIARNRNIVIIILVTMALLSVILYSVYRQHLLKNDQKILLLEQQALQTQMNPHFVFNALNSIKLYIINNEQKNAVYYLNKFSKLIRNILEVSKVKEVSLKEELSTMSLYMSIENIRFNNSISYVEKIHPDVNTDTIKVPPLILQPFLENSIWHGLSSKENNKEIILNAEKISDNIIEINVIDNGIGRDAAMEIKKNKSLKRNSVGIELTKERLATFCNEFTSEFSLKYIDLKDDEGNAIGTKVSLRIPLS